MNFKKLDIVKLILFANLGSFLFSTSVLAETQLTVPFPDISGGAPPSSVSGPAEYIQTVYKYSVGVGIFLAMLMIVVGAIRYTISEAVPSKGDAKDQITSAIWGLILLLGAFLIFTTINPKFETLRDPVLKLPGRVPEAQKPPETERCGDRKVKDTEACDPPGSECLAYASFPIFGICNDNCSECVLPGMSTKPRTFDDIFREMNEQRNRNR